MRRAIFILVSITLLSCSKVGQFQETTVEFTVNDITTGDLQEKALVTLLEIETPNAPFSSQIVKEIESFEIDYEDFVTHSFNAKRGAKFEYRIQFQEGSGSFTSGLGSITGDYKIVDYCDLVKKESNVCKLYVEPTATLFLEAENHLSDAEESDSINVELSDGNVVVALQFKGRGSSPSISTEIPHGYYTLSEWIYDDGNLVEEKSYPVEFHHNQDTSITIQF